MNWQWYLAQVIALSLTSPMFSRKWFFVTLLVLAGAGVCARLGFWQLDRLAQRKAFNARVQAQLAQPELQLSAGSFADDLYAMEYRAITITGEFDFTRQVALKNQAWESQYGVHLLAPLQVANTATVVYVDRGWIPGADASPENWARYDQSGPVTVQGVIRRPQAQPDFGRLKDTLPAPGSPPLTAWNLANIPAIASQFNLSALDIYIQSASITPSADTPSARSPIPALEIPELSEGSHFSYALQWFAFAGLLLVGYPVYVRRENLRLQVQA